MTAINKRKAGPIIPSSIDLQIEITPLSFDEMSRTRPGEPSAAIRERVIAARKIQEARFRADQSREEGGALVH